MTLKGKKFLLGVTGGIAAYKAAQLARLLVKEGADVRVAMTEAATRFVTPVTLQALTGQAVWTDLWDPRVRDNMGHIELSRDRELIVVAPATADFLAKLAGGLADDLLSTLCAARRSPLLVAPAMNVEMWENAATQRNVHTLRGDGVHFAGPAAGDQACGEVGMGRMLEPEEILAEIEALFQPKPLAGKRVLVTAGPTEEPIDPVRVITNASSGKMGYAVARAAREAGARVTLVSGPTALDAPAGVQRIAVRTAEQMFEAVKKLAPDSDLFFGVAAVSDYRVKNRAAQKIKKGAGGGMTLELIENPDILAWVAALKDAPFCVGFAAESEKLAENAQAKRAKKDVPLLVANLAQRALGADDSEVTLFDDDGRHPLGPAPKLELAREIVAHVARMLAGEKRTRAKA
ncbi:MAG: bifunctional phosphopantothenoylcysteine decarboxylase/phosphopantothenate--cysteine ligase CoaBC [Betaproteobacteria bacterium]|nr:bifunctional phosphopantothenoylcysteine decarboxylase/phosphopantothenate--cysteine ligase CoaBC [Betaproteobacteria bacterium]MDH5219658.1 bifunctional phosphopantothenoylcysteine decarboxylase/phosphopantothenate--cysteine ligase CoaBC [Betaproteobacteria bacterium]MDH5349629.1 bifunctional phosphopantothenoylcysteine decarboxylase/phosphopantothenate--cysteine ligase CoaBC [Betaproteobacteria bacterium]